MKWDYWHQTIRLDIAASVHDTKMYQLNQRDYKPILPVGGTVPIMPTWVIPGWAMAPTMPCCCGCPIMPWGGTVAESAGGETACTGITPLGSVATCDAGTITPIIPACWPPGTAVHLYTIHTTLSYNKQPCHSGLVVTCLTAMCEIP